MGMETLIFSRGCMFFPLGLPIAAGLYEKCWKVSWSFSAEVAFDGCLPGNDLAKPENHGNPIGAKLASC